jgi:phenylacetate-CoA ligase
VLETLVQPQAKQFVQPFGRDEPAGFAKALELFQTAAERVPGYKDFLKKHQVNPVKIKTYHDFRTLPIITKENYLTAYPLKDLLRDGETADTRVISVSSGSSGKPFYWPRGNLSIDQSFQIVGRAFDQSFQTQTKETLAIISFAMGTWIAGTYMYSAMLTLADYGHKIATITPGISKEEVLRILRETGSHFRQVILMGYPPFVKDILDAASQGGMDLTKFNLKLLFAGENFSEKWRDYVLDKIGQVNDLYATLSIYGTADAGIIGMESPLSIYARRLATQDQKLFDALFPNTSIVPTVVEYNPDLRFTEVIDGQLIFTVKNALPLVRYKIKDEGRLISHNELISTLESCDYEAPSHLVNINQQPYIALYGRPDVATMFYAVNIYPENIKYGLEVAELQPYLTGKFIIKAVYDDLTQEQTLFLQVELQKSVLPSEHLKQLINQRVLKSLQKNNSEFNKLRQEIKEKSNPMIILVPFGDPDFQIKIKHRWTAR